LSGNEPSVGVFETFRNGITGKPAHGTCNIAWEPSVDCGRALGRLE